MNQKFIQIICMSLFIGQLASAQSDSTIYKRVHEIVNQAKQNFAPDKRTKIIAITEENIEDNTYTIESTEKAAVSYIAKASKGINAKIKFNTLPEASLGEKTHGVINLSVANLRTHPGHASEMATQAILGTGVDILQKNSGEYRVRTPEGYISWIPTSSVVALDDDAYLKWKNSNKVIYTNDFGKSFSKPDRKSLRVSDLVYGNLLELLGQEDGFYKVSYPDARIAYIPLDEAVTFDKWINSRKLNADNLLSSAKTMIGLPYLWGGTSVKGVDCSGFTKTTFYMNGYVIPRDASQQVLAGEKVDILDAGGNFEPNKALKNLKPADLLFFASGKASNPNARVTHVAMYIGNGEFIQSAGTVRINSMLKDAKNYDDFQTRTVVAARRYIGVDDPQIQKIKDNPYYK